MKSFLFQAAVFLLISAPMPADSAQIDDTRLPRHFYISTRGDDGWSGVLPAPNQARTDGPWATLTRARDAIRELKESGQLDSAVVVMVEGGKYWLRQPVVWEGRDSGTRDKPITYTAYPGDRPVLSGGRPITGWKPYRGRNPASHAARSEGGRMEISRIVL